MNEATTVEEQVHRALEAYAYLEGLGEDVEEEWTYVTDLGAAWRNRLEDAVAARGAEPVGPSQVAALDQAIDEIGRITDPHRAIDWLSTFPQVVLVALEDES